MYMTTKLDGRLHSFCLLTWEMVMVLLQELGIRHLKINTVCPICGKIFLQGYDSRSDQQVYLCGSKRKRSMKKPEK